MYATALRHCISIVSITVIAFAMSAVIAFHEPALMVALSLGIVSIGTIAYFLGFRFGIRTRFESERPRERWEGEEPTPAPQADVARAEQAFRELDELCEQAPVDSGGRLLSRDELHERR